MVWAMMEQGNYGRGKCCSKEIFTEEGNIIAGVPAVKISVLIELIKRSHT